MTIVHQLTQTPAHDLAAPHCFTCGSASAVQVVPSNAPGAAILNGRAAHWGMLQHAIAQLRIGTPGGLQ
jgi:hypothetical protein